MKWRVMEFEDKEFLWLHLIWNLTPKIYSGSVAHPPCLMPSPSFSRATRQEPLTVPCGPNKQSHRIFSGRWSITFIFLSLRQLPVPATTTDTWPRANCQNNPQRKILGARTRTNKNFNPHVTSGPGIEREDSTFTTAPSPLPGHHFLPEKCSNLRNGRGYMVPLLSFL